MATISKFYLHDATSPNTGTLPTLSPNHSATVTGDATGAATCRDATGVIGTANPDTEASYTGNANTLQQGWGVRRFISRPLAAQTITGGSAGTWTFSYAATESNAAHNGNLVWRIDVWRPSTGLAVASGLASSPNPATEPGTSQTAISQNDNGTGSDFACADGDFLVFDCAELFTQSMATAYSFQLAYDGTTEASTTTCASFISTTQTLTLFGARVPRNSAVNHQNPAVLMEGMEQDKRNHLWFPRRKLWRPWIETPPPVMI